MTQTIFKFLVFMSVWMNVSLIYLYVVYTGLVSVMNLTLWAASETLSPKLNFIKKIQMKGKIELL